MQSNRGVLLGALGIMALAAGCGARPDASDESEPGTDEAKATATTAVFTGKYVATHVRDGVERPSSDPYTPVLSFTFYEDGTREEPGGWRMYNYFVQEGPRREGDSRHLTLGFVKRNNVRGPGMPKEIRDAYKFSNMLRLAVPRADNARVSEWYLVRGTAMGNMYMDACPAGATMEECHRQNPWPCIGETGVSVQCGTLEIAGPMPWKGDATCPAGTRAFKPVYTPHVCVPDDPWGAYYDRWPNLYRLEAPSTRSNYEPLRCHDDDLVDECRGDDFDQQKGIVRGGLVCFEGEPCSGGEHRAHWASLGLIAQWADDATPIADRAETLRDFKQRRTMATIPRGPAEVTKLPISKEHRRTPAIICSLSTLSDLNDACH